MDDARAELLELVRQGSTDLSRAGELVDVLLDSRLPFKEALIGGGPWEVVYSRGPLLWQGFTAAGNALSKRRLARSPNRVGGACLLCQPTEQACEGPKPHLSVRLHAGVAGV